MGLFSSYDKPGRGISKNAPKKKGFFRYFEMFFRKFTKLILLNMLYFLCSIPMMVVLYIAFTFITSYFFSTFPNIPLSQNDIFTFESITALFLTMTSVIILGSGPASASAAYAMRNYSKEEHVWLFSDFFEKMKENFKQGIAVSIIDIAVTVIGWFAIIFYYNKYITSGGSLILFIILWILVLGLILYTLMHYYIYQLMVTFKNTISQIYKNALILTLGSVIPLALISVLAVACSYFLCSVPFMAILISFICGITFLRFPAEFYVADSIQKKILDSIPNDTEKPSVDTTNANETTTNGSEL